MTEAEFQQYKDKMQEIKQLQATGGPAKQQALQVKMGEFQKWLQESILSDAAKATTFKTVMQEEAQRCVQIRKAHQLNAKVRIKKLEAVTAVLTHVENGSELLEKYKSLCAVLKAAKKDKDQKLRRQTDREIKALLVDSAGEEKFEAVQEIGRRQRLENYKRQVEDQVGPLLEEMRLQLVLSGCGETEKQNLVGCLQKGVQPGDAIFQTALEHCVSSMTPEDREEMEQALKAKETQERNARLEEIARQLTVVVEKEVKEELYTEELIEKEESFVRQCETAAEGAGKENATAALKKFLASGVDAHTKALKEKVLAERYGEIASTMGVKITVQDENGLAINKVRAEMTNFLKVMQEIKKQILTADKRLQDAFGALDSIPGEVRESHAEAYNSAIQAAQEAQQEFEAVCLVANDACENVAAREVVGELNRSERTDTVWHDADEAATPPAESAEKEEEEQGRGEGVAAGAGLS